VSNASGNVSNPEIFSGFEDELLPDWRVVHGEHATEEAIVNLYPHRPRTKKLTVPSTSAAHYARDVELSQTKPCGGNMSRWFQATALSSPVSWKHEPENARPLLAPRTRPAGLSTSMVKTTDMFVPVMWARVISRFLAVAQMNGRKFLVLGTDRVHPIEDHGRAVLAAGDTEVTSRCSRAFCPELCDYYQSRPACSYSHEPLPLAEETTTAGSQEFRPGQWASLVHGHVHSVRVNGRQLQADVNDLRPTHEDEARDWLASL